MSRNADADRFSRKHRRFHQVPSAPAGTNALTAIAPRESREARRAMPITVNGRPFTVIICPTARVCAEPPLPVAIVSTTAGAEDVPEASGMGNSPNAGDTPSSAK